MWIWIANKYAKFHAKKNLTKVKIFQKVLGGYFFWNTLYMSRDWNCWDRSFFDPKNDSALGGTNRLIERALLN